MKNKKQNLGIVAAFTLLSTSLATIAGDMTFDDMGSSNYLHMLGLNTTNGVGIYAPNTQIIKNDDRELVFESSRPYVAGMLSVDHNGKPTLLNATAGPYEDYLIEACVDHRDFQDRNFDMKLPYENKVDSKIGSQYGGRYLRHYKAQLGVDFPLNNKKHGGANKYLYKDNIYTWYIIDVNNLGYYENNGLRRVVANKKHRDNGAFTKFYQLGNYYLISVVYADKTDISGGSISWDFAGDGLGGGLPSVNKFNVIDSCDIARVEVVPNTSPTASFSAYESNKSARMTSYLFNASASADADNNPLTFLWFINGSKVKETSNPRFNHAFPTPEFRTENYTVKLVVTDGGAPGTFTKNVSIAPYCFSCNGEMIP